MNKQEALDIINGNYFAAYTSNFRSGSSLRFHKTGSELKTHAERVCRRLELDLTAQTAALMERAKKFAPSTLNALEGVASFATDSLLKLNKDEATEESLIKHAEMRLWVIDYHRSETLREDVARLSRYARNFEPNREYVLTYEELTELDF